MDAISENEKVKILHVGEYMQGGVSTYLSTILNIDKKYFEEYIILSYDKSSHVWDLDDNHIKYYNYRRGIFGVILAMRTVYAYITKLSPDIIYCHSTWAGIIARLPLIFYPKKRAKVIYNAHGWSFTMQVSKFKKLIFSLVEQLLTLVTDCIVNVSNYEYNVALKYRISSKKMIVIYSGSNPINEDTIEKNKLDDSNINLLFVGRFDPQKGVDYLLDKFQKCARRDINIFLIGGSVVSTNKFNNVSDSRIHFLGWIPHEEMSSYYSACDAVIMPSRWEAFGLVAIEAMKHKKPVIVSNRGALTELIKNNYNGYVFDMDDESSIMDIFYKLKKDKLVKLGNNAFKEFNNYYSASLMREKTKALYLKLMSEKQL